MSIRNRLRLIAGSDEMGAFLLLMVAGAIALVLELSNG
jgi:hypothetical protein